MNMYKILSVELEIISIILLCPPPSHSKETEMDLNEWFPYMKVE